MAELKDYVNENDFVVETESGNQYNVYMYCDLDTRTFEDMPHNPKFRLMIQGFATIDEPIMLNGAEIFNNHAWYNIRRSTVESKIADFYTRVDRKPLTDNMRAKLDKDMQEIIEYVSQYLDRMILESVNTAIGSRRAEIFNQIADLKIAAEKLYQRANDPGVVRNLAFNALH